MALNAFQVESATIATPDGRPGTPSRTNASRTPGRDFTASMLALETMPPKTGHFVYVAYIIPGTLTSMPKSGAPVTIFALSTPGTRVPISLKSFGFLRFVAVGVGIVAAFVANSP